MAHRIAIIGNPNEGKSTLFNVLCKENQHTGNWPGKTVEKKQGTYSYNGKDYEITDLPGIYHVNCETAEGKIVSKYLEKEKPEAIVVVLDSNSLSKGLVLGTQLRDSGMPIIVDLNMVDELEEQGKEINEQELEREFGSVPVKTIAVEGKGIEELKQAIGKAIGKPAGQAKKICESEDDLIARSRKANELARKMISQPKKLPGRNLDSIVMHRILGLPLFLLTMYLIFSIVFFVGTPLTAMIEGFFSAAKHAVAAAGSGTMPQWLLSLINDGVISGVGAILAFLPSIMLLYGVMALLEDLGYLPRMAIVIDRIMQGFGMSGRSFLPMVLGFGCNVPAIMAARTIAGENERLNTILVSPFVSCSARLPIYVLFAGVFFPGNEAAVIFGIYVLGIAAAVVSSLVIRKLALRTETLPMIMELPPYRKPVLRHIARRMWRKSSRFLTKAGTFILATSLVIWLLASLPFGVEYGSRESVIGMIGGTIAPILEPAGFGTWQASVALISGLAAKETVVSTLGVVYSNGVGLEQAIGHAFTPLSGLAFMVFTLLYVPCMATVATIRSETSWKWALFQVVYSTLLAWVAAVAVFQAGKWIGF